MAPLARRLALPNQVDPDLRERTSGTRPPGAGFETAVAASWRLPGRAFSGVESNRAAGRRVMTVVRCLPQRYPSRNLVLATHGSLALLLHQVDATLGFRFWRGLTMPDIDCLRLAHDSVAVTRCWPPCLARPD